VSRVSSLSRGKALSHRAARICPCSWQATGHTQRAFPLAKPCTARRAIRILADLAHGDVQRRSCGFASRKFDHYPTTSAPSRQPDRSSLRPAGTVSFLGNSLPAVAENRCSKAKLSPHRIAGPRFPLPRNSLTVSTFRSHPHAQPCCSRLQQPINFLRLHRPRIPPPPTRAAVAITGPFVGNAAFTQTISGKLAFGVVLPPIQADFRVPFAQGPRSKRRNSRAWWRHTQPHKPLDPFSKLSRTQNTSNPLKITF